jgi:hypothetical protein
MKRLIAALLLGCMALSLTACHSSDKPVSYSRPPATALDGSYYGKTYWDYSVPYDVTADRSDEKSKFGHLLPGQWVFYVPTGNVHGCKIQRQDHTRTVAGDWKLIEGQKLNLALREGDTLFLTGWCDGKWNRA